MSNTGKSVAISRRKALSRLGLAAAAVYAAPTVTRIDDAEARRQRRARPSVVCPGSSCSGHGKGKGKGKGKGGGKGKGKSGRRKGK